MGSAIAAVLPRFSPTQAVRVRKLSDAIALALRVSGKERLAFIKADIEGAEGPVFGEAVATLRHHRPRIAIEPHPDATGVLTTESVSASLHEAGYSTEVVRG